MHAPWIAEWTARKNESTAAPRLNAGPPGPPLVASGWVVGTPFSVDLGDTLEISLSSLTNPARLPASLTELLV